MSTEDEDMDNAVGSVNSVDGITGMKKVELTEDIVSSGLAQDMKVRSTTHRIFDGDIPFLPYKLSIEFFFK